MMRHLRQRFGIGFGREQIESAINLKSIGAEDFRAGNPGDFRGDLRFSSRRRPDDEEGATLKKETGRRASSPGCEA